MTLTAAQSSPAAASRTDTPPPGRLAEIMHGRVAPNVKQLALIQDGYEDRRPLDSHFGAWVVCTENPAPFRVVALDENGLVLDEINGGWTLEWHP